MPKKKAASVLQHSSSSMEKGIDIAFPGAGPQDVFFRTDADGKITWVSSSIARAMGYNTGSLIGQDLGGLFHFNADTREQFFQKLQKGAFINDYEIEIRTRDGCSCSVTVDAQCQFTENGEIAGYEGNWRDNTYLKKNDTALRQSRERFRTAFLASPDSVSIIRLKDGIYIDVNDGFTEIMGYTRDEVVGRSSAEIGLLLGHADQKTLITDVTCGGSVISKQIHFKDKSGRVRKGLLSTMTMTFDNEPHFLCIIKDVDAFRKTEEALELSEIRFQGLFNQMTNGVVVLSARDNGSNFECVDLNRAVERKENTSKENLLGKGIAEIFPGIEESGLLNVIKRVWRTGDTEHFSDTRYVESSLVTWRNNYIYRLPSGEVILIYDDITDQKRVEEKLFEYQEQLRNLASELSLAEERERRAIATDLHDQIGQTLSVIKLKLYELREKLSEDGQIMQLDEIRDYLDQTICDTRSLTSELSPPILYELGLEAAIEWLAEHFQEKHGIKTNFHSDGLPKPVSDDIRGVLFRAVRELLVNVVKHAQAKKVEIEVNSDIDYVRIDLVDDGVGFNPQEIAARVVGNHAFGLFNIRERLEHLSGYLGIDSRPGQGTRMTIAAPLDIDGSTGKEGQ